MRFTSLWPVVSLGALSLIWGYNWVVMKSALKDCPPLLFASMRVLGGTAILFLLLKGMNRSLRRPPLGFILPLGLLQSTGFVGCTLWALEYGGAGKTAILVYMMPLWLILLAWLCLGERIPNIHWAALGLAALGIVFILEPWRIHGGKGVILALFSGFFWAASAIWHKKRAPPGLDLLDATAWQMLFGGVVLSGLALCIEPMHVNFTVGLGWALFYNAVPGNALAWLLWSYSLHHLPSGVAGMGTLLAPAVGILSAWLQLGERPGPFEGLGMFVLFFAMLLVSWEHLRNKDETSFSAAPE